MNIYDFDGTIYDGDSSIDFFKYCIKKNKRTLLELPKIAIACVLYMLKIKEKEFFKSSFFAIVKYFDNIDKIVDDFWKINKKKIKPLYLSMHKNNDVVISASPEFLLLPIANDLKFKLIATIVDKKTGKLLGNNCYGIEKVKRLKEKNIFHCENFYTDSYSDLPMTNISNNSFFFIKDKITKFENFKPSIFKKITKMLMSREFVTFLAIGVINVFNGIFISLFYSNYILNDILAYILGFFTSLCIAYVLNSLLNFKERLSLIKLVKFAINNIPNFIIQVLSVVIFIELLGYPKIIGYSISAVIAVPITFILIKVNVFNNN